MKKLLCLILIAAVAVCTGACMEHKKESLNVYFKNRGDNSLNAERRTMKVTDKTSDIDRAKFLISQIIKGPQDENSEALISENAQILSIGFNNGVATINMSKEFSEAKSVKALLLRLSFVNTLCALEDINGIVIQVEGKPIISEATGKEIGVIKAENVAFDTDDEEAYETMNIALYFTQKGGDKLSKENRKVKIGTALSLEKTVISELLKGPESTELVSAIPSDTKLLGIETKDGVCFVNFSNEFVAKISPGSLETTLALYSVVNSLCALENVRSVQILINGENGVEFGNYVLDIPYEQDESMIE